jgi:succinate dehydrogenase / fumarate reductase cytochrome b subunit
MTKLRYLGSSIGRKQLVGVAGLALALFVLIHMAGNMLIFVSDRAYNEYSHALTSNPLIYVAEIGLLAFFSAHVIVALVISVKNRLARPHRYAVSTSGDKRTTMVQKTLWFQGLIILIFVILHLITFKYGPHYVVDYGHGEIRDLHRLVVEVFRQPIYVGWYVVCLALLMAHLGHGLGSSFQTLGFYHPRYQPMIKCLSWVYGLVVGLGFISQPLYVFFFLKG